MNKYSFLPVSLILTLLHSPPSMAQNAMRGPDEAAFTVHDSPGIGLGARFQFEQREFKLNGQPEGVNNRFDADIAQFYGRAGGNPVPFLHLIGEAGYSSIDLDTADGDGGFSWALGFQADILDRVLESSPVVGHKRVLSLGLEGWIRQVTAEFGADDLDYNEFQIMPTLRYTHNRRGEPLSRPYQPTGVTAELGFAYSYVDGELGSSDFEAEQEFGLLLGTSFRLWRGWMADLRGIIYGNSDFSLSFGPTYFF
jgi:hypothetical protein